MTTHPLKELSQKNDFSKNNILILSSAVECDYFVTYDLALKALSSRLSCKPQIVTPEQLLSQLGSKA
jgi:predicted nucleic acid-binding protein